MIDDASMNSIISHTEINPGYVIAIDANNETSEQYQFGDDSHDEAKPVPWDGTMMINVDSIFTDFYLRGIGENSMVMGEIHGDMGEVWDGI